MTALFSLKNDLHADLPVSGCELLDLNWYVVLVVLYSRFSTKSMIARLPLLACPCSQPMRIALFCRKLDLMDCSMFVIIC